MYCIPKNQVGRQVNIFITYIKYTLQGVFGNSAATKAQHDGFGVGPYCL